ncbi:MAG TPA: tRNA guanosine(34) transglycosylase Tgt [Caldithrix abyssi]|uniref:Queuine tRNA-ribosyltransferase n=1 Tax=Caldithrix abyssi TaxID=187145 RepID=A0A7V4U2E8_CALAY|nr:tRNA guanosine(34) transglycosylase Tgt [Caldithrix abyssi]
MFFKLIHTDKSTKARAGLIQTDHGTIETPIFMPVGTQATVKTLSPRDLDEIQTQIILSNTYHLFLRPGQDLIEEFGGLHRFMSWNKPILTDSGGYQVFSLQELRKLDENGVHFQSHLDGSRHTFTPKSVFETQRKLGSDIMMVLDECAPYPADEAYVDKSNDLTLRWAEIARNLYETTQPLYGHRQWLFGIVQGGTFLPIREKSARALIEMDFPGYAIGGLAVGEPQETMMEMTDFCTDLLPESKPRYLMGVGKPHDILEAIERGVDMFDCVIPTRNARNGTVFTFKGKMVLKAARFKNDRQPIDSDCRCYTCTNFSRGYLRHLYNADEILGLHLATLHNVHFYLQLVKEARNAILNNRYAEWKTKIISSITKDILN